ncbi:MAG TPA: cupin domain-containing protein [Bacillota bacterium]|nr:cupin domain-containing protein [Bacillota bacterium]
MDTEAIKAMIKTNVHHIVAGRTVPLHKHADSDEVFYCIAGEGFGVLEDRDVRLEVGQTFIVPAGTMHALKTDSEIYVCAFQIPKVVES